MALLTDDGSIFSGGAIESCAYNPTINPLQAACILLAAKGITPCSEEGLVSGIVPVLATSSLLEDHARACRNGTMLQGYP